MSTVVDVSLVSRGRLEPRNVCARFQRRFRAFAAKFNEKIEDFFYYLGSKLLFDYPISIYVVTCLLFGLLGIGITTAVFQNDIYKLWIDSGSRLIGEMNFQNSYFQSARYRDEFMLVENADLSGDILSNDTLAWWYQMHLKVETVNYTYVDPHTGAVEYYATKDICRRPAASSLFQSVFDLAGIPGIPPGVPCFRSTVLDCFIEGSYDYIFPADPTVPIYSGLNRQFLQIPDNYVDGGVLPSFAKMNHSALGARLAKSCNFWQGTPAPINFLMGGYTASPPNTGPLVQIQSFETIYELESTAYFANALYQRVCAGTCLNNCDTAVGTMLNTAFNTATVCTVTNCGSILINGLVNVCNCSTCTTFANTKALPSCLACQQSNAVCAGVAYANFTGSVCAAQCAAPVPGNVTNALVYGAFCHQQCTQSLCGSLGPPSSYTDKASTILDGWEQNYMNLMENLNNNDPYLQKNGLALRYYTDRSTRDLLLEANSGSAKWLLIVGFFLMLVYAGISNISFHSMVESRMLVGVVGAVTSLFAVLGGLGLSALIGIQWSAIISTVAPVLGMVLSIGDWFVIVGAFRYDATKSLREMCGDCMRESAAAVMLSAVCNICAFGVGSALPLPAVSTFAATVALCVACNFVLAMFAYGSLIVLDARRMHAGRIDCCPCFVARKTEVSRVREDDSVPKFVVELSKLLENSAVKVPVFLGLIALLAVGCYGTQRIQVGLPIHSIVPTNNYAYHFFDVRDRLYFEATATFDVGYDHNVGNVALQFNSSFIQILNAQDLIDNNYYVDNTVSLASGSYLNNFLLWINTVGLITPAASQGQRWHPEFGRYLLMPTAANFYTFFNLWKTQSPTYAQFTDQIAFYNVSNPAIQPLIFGTESDFYLYNLVSQQDNLDAITQTRAITDATGLPIFPGGDVFQLNEQYLNSKKDLVLFIIYCFIGVFVASALVLLSFHATVLLCAVILCTIVDVIGYMTFWGIYLNEVCTVSVMFAIATGVGTACYITRAFMVSTGNKQERASRAFVTLFLPVTNGLVGGFLVDFLLLFSEFPYFVTYFFNMYVLMVIFSFANGLLLLPIILSWLGPPSLVESHRRTSIPGRRPSVGPKGDTEMAQGTTTTTAFAKSKYEMMQTEGQPVHCS